MPGWLLLLFFGVVSWLICISTPTSGRSVQPLPLTLDVHDLPDQPHAGPPPRTFDYYYFVQTWPKSFFKLNPKPVKNIPKFTIHGLWPQYFKGSAPIFCDRKNMFDLNKIASLRSKLDQEWLALSEDLNFKLWKYQWDKHGTCSRLLQKDYFEKALDLKAKYDIVSILDKADIKANGTAYPLQLVSTAIARAIGFTARVQCNALGGTQNYLLYEVYICVDLNQKPINCPPAPKAGNPRCQFLPPSP